MDWSAIFFKYFWSALKGKEKIADEFLHDLRCGYYNTATAQGIRFHCPDDDGPDFLVSLLFVFCFGRL